MEKVLLLGDSIRMGYQEYVKELLKDECEVVFPDENGRFSSYTLWLANQMFKAHPDIKLVHLNNGYWDMNIEAPMTEPMHPIEEYLHFLKRTVSFIRAQGAKVVFATTVPVLKKGSAGDVTGVEADISYDDSHVRAYNDAAKALMAELGVPVNDMYALCLEDERYYKCADMLHLTEEGYRRCAESVVKALKEL